MVVGRVGARLPQTLTARVKQDEVAEADLAPSEPHHDAAGSGRDEYLLRNTGRTTSLVLIGIDSVPPTCYRLVQH